MPKLSDTMTEGTVSKWLKKIGDNVKSGEILAEIDSDKATMEFESFYDGILLYIGTPDKKSAPVDSVLAIIGKQGEDISKILEEEKKKVSSTQPAVGKKEEVKKSEPKKEVPVERKVETVVSSPSAISHQSSGFIKASPLAKKLAKDRNLKISLIGGSGEGGRIVK